MIDTLTIGVESIGTVAGSVALAVWALREKEVKPKDLEPSQTSLRFRFRQAGKTRVLAVGGEAILGRAPSCDIAVDDPSVSKRHARVTYDGSAWIEDLESTNGSYVNGKRVEGTTVLRRGDRIALGTAKIVFLGLGVRGKTDSKG